MKYWVLVAVVLCATAFASGQPPPPPGSAVMPSTENLRTDTASGKPLVVMFSSSSCGYCARLEREQFVPLIISGHYRERVLIRKLSLDPGITAVDVDGTAVATDSIAKRYGVMVTPTVLLLGPDGQELAERLIGFGLPDFYGAYLDKSIRAAERELTSGDARPTDG